MLRLKEFNGRDLSMIIGEINRHIEADKIININEHLRQFVNQKNEPVYEWTLRVYYRD